MTLAEFLVILFGLWGGYWIVSKLLARKETSSEQRNAESGHDFGTDGTNKKSESTEAWYDVLRVSSSATVDEIRHSYKALMSQYHPDKAHSLGDELKALAERKTKEITQAYRDAMRIRG
jgi:DnaJ-domain-containing protein 1